MTLVIEYQRDRFRRTARFPMVVLICLTISSCIHGAYYHLRTQAVPRMEPTGTYTVFLYGCRHPDDLETVAILDREGDPYTIEIFAPDFQYKVKKGLSAREALDQAKRLVACSIYYQKTQINEIVDATGYILGYDVRALYSPVIFGRYDVLDIQYVMHNRKVIVYIKLDPTVEKALRNEGDRKGMDGIR